MISYSINWMGVVNMQWYRDRGLTRTVHKVMEKDSVFSDQWKMGDLVQREEITQEYSCGRIDVGGTGDPYGDEIDVPPMQHESWLEFGNWLWNFKTDEMWTLDQLVAEYEKTNPKIKWAEGY